ncbi:hypothetical protein ACWD5Q_12830 [Streptomyces sp. NPDC002513]
MPSAGIEALAVPEATQLGGRGYRLMLGATAVLVTLVYLVFTEKRWL